MLHLVPFVILCVVSILGTIGNVFIIAAVSLRKKLRVRGNIFVINLAIADLIITSYIMPIGLMTSQYEVNPFNHTMCEINAFIIMTSCGVSTQSLMMIAVERYLHICKTHWYRRVFTRNICAFLVVFCWVYTMIWTCQGWTGWTEYFYGPNIYVCIFDGKISLAYDVCLAFFGMILPIIVSAVCYYKIFKTVKSSRKSLYIERSQTRSNDTATQALNKSKLRKLKKEKQLVVTLFTIVIIFIIFWLPAAIVLSVIGLFPDLPAVIFTTFMWAALSNSSVNSIIYGAMNKNFRAGYIALFRWIFCCGSKNKCKQSTTSTTSAEDSPAGNNNSVNKSTVSKPTKAKSRQYDQHKKNTHDIDYDMPSVQLTEDDIKESNRNIEPNRENGTNVLNSSVELDKSSKQYFSVV